MTPADAARLHSAVPCDIVRLAPREDVPWSCTTHRTIFRRPGWDRPEQCPEGERDQLRAEVDRLLAQRHAMEVRAGELAASAEYYLAEVERLRQWKGRAIDDLTRKEQQRDHWMAEVERLRALINTPEIADFAKAVQVEAAHQRERWGAEHDAVKTPADWFWLIGYLAGKALHNPLQPGDDGPEKRLHRIVTVAAAAANWHAAERESMPKEDTDE